MLVAEVGKAGIVRPAIKSSSAEWFAERMKQMGTVMGDQQSGPRFRFPAVAVICLLCAVLSLATASECHSITHLPSLVYGMVLWFWWGCIAGALWMLGARMPFILRFSPASISLRGWVHRRIDSSAAARRHRVHHA
jgi:hypothetical protein